MGNRYDHYFHHHHHQKSTFLPMLCSKPSIKDVSIPKSLPPPAVSTSTSAAVVDPLSPKVGCMGQVKRNNRITTFPPSQTLTITKPHRQLNKFFSGKNLINTTKTTTRSISCRTQRSMIRDCSENRAPIKIGDMDPPLPVIKKRIDEGDGDSLWKRRSGGIELKTLQVQQIFLSNHHLQPTTV